MSVGRGVMVVASVLLVSGCAGGQTRQDLARVQSQVGMLDARVSQLERVGASGLSAAPVSDATLEGGSTATLMKESASAPTESHGKSRHHKHTKEVAAASVPSTTKPSTREVQQALKNAGFYQGAVDGKMGGKTHEAIKEFQRVHGLKDDGVAGTQTWAKLHTYAELSAGEGSAATTAIK